MGSASSSRRASAATDSDDEREARKVVLLGTGFSGKTCLFRAGVGLGGAESEQRAQQWPREMSNAFPPTHALNERLDAADAIPDELACDVSGERNPQPEELARVLGSREYQRALALFPQAAAPASSARYLAERLSGGALGSPPTSLDICHLSLITTGVISRCVTFNGAPLQLYDTGGQRNERKKWPHILARSEGGMTIVFVASLYHHGRVIFEDWDKDALEESLELLAALTKQYGETVPILLVLTGADALEEALLERGAGENAGEVTAQLLDRFREVCPRVRHWLVNAVDEGAAAQTMREVFAAVQSSA